ncbi:MAG: class I SAM-dependent methyltransferase [bacterium]|nr:class I SAM-dependent methyltransferase [bacterium]
MCRSKDITLFKKGTFDPQHIKTENFKITDSAYGSLWTFSICKNCRFVFSNPYVPEENIVEFYSQLQDREYSTEAEGRTKNFKTIFKRIKRLQKKTGTPDNTLLDIGAAGGIFLHLAQQENYGIEGIEPSQYLVNEAKERYNIDLFQGTAEEYKTNKKFSVITLLDIIEHLVEPETFMTTIDNLIEKNGLLVVVTPDVTSLAARLTGKRWWHYRIAHINFFNRHSLRYLLEQHNYEIILKKKYVWNFSLFYLITRIFPLLKNKKTLQTILKKVHLKLPLFDSWEIYARKRKYK